MLSALICKIFGHSYPVNAIKSLHMVNYKCSRCGEWRYK
jgi:hypothetical protein